MLTVNESPDAELFRYACDLLRTGAAADFAYFAEVTPANEMRLRAGSVWADDPSGALPPLAAVQARAALTASAPLVVKDYRADERFPACDDAVGNGILSGVTVPVASGGRTFGVLAAHSRTAGHFRQEIIELIEMLGRMVALAYAELEGSESRKRQAKLEQSTRLSELGRLAATIAHQFNNVLMGVLPFVDVIRRAPSKQKIEKALDHITDAIRRGQRVTGNILRFTQPAEPVRTRVELPAWLAALAAEGRSALGGRFAFEVDAEPLAIDADPEQLQQIFLNLILNARDAMPSGGTITLTARRDRAGARYPFGAVEHPDRFAHLVAADSGSGIADEDLAHIFEPLFTTKRTATGLGLSVAHQVVQRHGGEIFVESGPGAGTAFHIFLPLSEREATAVPRTAHEHPHDVAAPRRILLVEDDPIVAAGLSELLEYEGFQVTLADSGRAAIRAVLEGPPADAVILDVGLPDMDGTAVFEKVAAARPDLPVIFSTGHADRARLDGLASNRQITYLLKPYDSEALMNALSEVASRRQTA